MDETTTTRAPGDSPGAETTSEARPRGRHPKPSERLNEDALRVLSALLDGGVGIETIAALARSSESTVRRFHDGKTGSRTSVSGIALAVVVAACRNAPEVVAREHAALLRLSRAHTPGGVGLDLPELARAHQSAAATAPTAAARARGERRARTPKVTDAPA